MVRALFALAALGGAGWLLLGNRSQEAFGPTGIPWAPTLGAFDGFGGVPLSAGEIERRDQGLDDGSLGLELGWLTDAWPTGNDGDTGSDGDAVAWYSDDWSIFDMTDPRGLRNNNPGNIEYNGTAWQGLDSPPSDGRFARFSDPVYGIRAMSRILDTYRDRHGLNTVQSIISRWAPAHENNTTAYTDYVARRVGVDPMQPLTQSDRPAVIAAMIKMENGEQPYPMSLIEQGVALA